MTDRRAFVVTSGSAIAALMTAASPDEVSAALRYARAAVEGQTKPPWQVLTDEQAADVEAIASQIIPTDDTPGAREAGVVYFIDKSLATWAAGQKDPLVSGLADLNKQVAAKWPGTARFSALAATQQTEILKAQEKTPFFGLIRFATITGMFANPSYGGNREKVGWKLLGFEDRFQWQPPFGDYDRDGGR